MQLEIPSEFICKTVADTSAEHKYHWRNIFEPMTLTECLHFTCVSRHYSGWLVVVVGDSKTLPVSRGLHPHPLQSVIIKDSHYDGNFPLHFFFMT